MSILTGAPTDRWSLTQAADALGESARQSGRPGLVWIVGLFYPSATLGVSSMWEICRRGTFGPLPDLYWRAPGGDSSMIVTTILQNAVMTTVMVLLFFPLSRLVAGLARVSPRSAWNQATGARSVPRISTLWRSGSGMTLSVIGLWIQFIVMVIGVLLAILLPAESIARPILAGARESTQVHMLVGGLLLGPVVLLCAAYLLAISVLTQLALHSLAHNRRGVGSALLHAWRIMQHDPRATARAVLVDLVLSLAILALFGLVYVPLGDWIGCLVLLALSGYAGCTRSGYWARAYRALGGLSPDDGVPGLPSTTA